MNNWCICWFFTNIFTGILIFKGLTARRLYMPFDVKGLNFIEAHLKSSAFPGRSARKLQTAADLLSQI
jgi:hypothetical protein